MKKCFKCNKEKPLNGFYNHKGMSDGCVNKCKECNKKDVKENYYKKSNDIVFMEKERERGRERYKRLGYYNKYKDTLKLKPWALTSRYKNVSRKIKAPKGFELHHWSYSNENIEDVFILERRQHKQAHTHLILDIESRLFKTKDGVILTTRQDHFEYLLKMNIKF